MNSIFGIIIARWEDKVRNENQSITCQMFLKNLAIIMNPEPVS